LKVRRLGHTSRTPQLFVVDPGIHGPRKLFLSINEHSSRHSKNFGLLVTKTAFSGTCSRPGKYLPAPKKAATKALALINTDHVGSWLFTLA